MADTTSHTQEVSRDEAADLLQAVARELRGEERAHVDVGNKTVELSPTSAVEYDVTVDERSPMIGGDEETITLTLSWTAEDE